MIFLNSEELPRQFQVGDPSTYTVLNVLVCIWSEGCLPLVRTIHAAADKLLGVWPIEPIHPLYDKFSFLRHVGSINISSIYRGCLQCLVYRRRHRGRLIQYLVTVMSNTNISQYRYKNLLMWTSCLNLKNADRYFTRKKLKYY